MADIDGLQRIQNCAAHTFVYMVENTILHYTSPKQPPGSFLQGEHSLNNTGLTSNGDAQEIIQTASKKSSSTHTLAEYK